VFTVSDSTTRKTVDSAPEHCLPPLVHCVYEGVFSSHCKAISI
jgi:hypothetical protein